jgi:putative tryptophan/tyrosine transport system substrate-binding protein
MMDRRRFLVASLAGAIGAPLIAGAQQAARVFRIGAVSAGAPRSSPHWVAFGQRLTELGYVEGKNLVTEFRNADGHQERLPELMKDLVRLNVDVLVPVGPEASLLAA